MKDILSKKWEWKGKKGERIRWKVRKQLPVPQEIE